jgi:subtilisin family serine protease
MINTKKIGILGLTAIILAAMPGFSVLTAPLQAAAETSVSSGAIALPAATYSFVMQLKDGNTAALSQDSKIKNIEHVFVGSSYEPFKNTIRIDTAYSKAEFLQKYGNNVVYIDPEHFIKVSGAQVNDPGFSENIYNVDRQWGLHKSHFPEAWDKVPGNNNVVIAMVDTGVDGTHEDLSSGQIIPGFNFLTKTIINSNEDSDDNGHGTLVAGVIGATPNNFRGIAGASWNSLIMPLKALDSAGSGNSADVAAAIVYATDHGASVINLSLGGVGFANDTTLASSIRYAYTRNVIVVAAAGNDVSATGSNLDISPVFPICNDNGENMVIGVAASDINDLKADFSNYGKACVDIIAPGKRILSTINHDPVLHTKTDSSYAYASGTSLAAPFVSAAAAMIKSLYPNLSNVEIRNRILKTTDQIDQNNTTNCNNQTCAGLLGTGRLNILKALDPNVLLKAEIREGDLVRDNTGAIYYISSGKRQPVSNYVLTQRFGSTTITDVKEADLAGFPVGAYALPNENTVVKSANSPVVYQIVGGIKRPMTWQVFVQRGFSQIATLSEAELASWVTGKFLPPIEGTIVKGQKGAALYWVLEQQFHIMNYDFWVQRGLQDRGVMIVPDSDLQSYPIGNAFIR